MEARIQKRWLILLGLLLLIVEVDAQNLVFNGGFEDGNVSAADQNYNEATWHVDFTADQLYSWRRAKDAEGTTHSPDWRYMSPAGINFGKNSNIDITMLQPGVTLITVFPPAAGNAMIGLGKHELIQQAVDISKMHAMADENTPMVLRFKVRIPSVGSVQSNSKLSIYFSKDKLTYKKNKDKDSCEEKFAELDHYNDYEEIVGYDQLTSRFPSGEWHQVEYYFSAPERIDEYEWLAFNLRSFESQSGCGITNNYLYVDDVELFIGCPDLCSRTDGLFNDVGLVTNFTIGTSSVFTVNNLNSVNQVTFKVWSAIGALVYENSAYCINGISHPIYWDGTTSGGAMVASANYRYELELTKNGCGSIKRSGALTKLSGTYTGVNHTNFNAICENGVVSTPEPCCSLTPDILKDYESLPGPGRLEYIAVNSVQACTKAPDFSDEVVVQNGADVLFRAGAYIVLAEGFNTINGAVFVAEIKPCEKSAKAQVGKETGSSGEMQAPSPPAYEQSPKADDRVQGLAASGAEALQVYPNPSVNGICQIGLNGITINPDNLPQYRVYNVNGEVVLSGKLSKAQTEIDLRNYPRGVYLVYVNVNGRVLTTRLVYQ